MATKTQNADRDEAITSRRRGFLRTNRQQEALWFWITVSPWLIGFLIFTLGPVVASIYLSFTDWDFFNPPQLVGLDNYQLLFTNDLFWKVLGNTFYYALLAIPLGLVAATVLAYLLNQQIQGMRFYRTLFYLPALVPIVVSSFVFIWLLAPAGLINDFLGVFGIDGPRWLLDEAWVKPALVIMSLWGVGGAMVLILAGMQGIPKELYEAAELDGAGESSLFFRITLPMLTPILFFNLVMGVIGSLQTFTQVYLMTSGGPNNASMMMVPFLFQIGFEFYRMGQASAVAWILFIIILSLTLLVFRSSSLWVFYESEVRR